MLALHEICYNSAVTVLAQVHEGSVSSWLVQVLCEQGVRSTGVTMTLSFLRVDKDRYVPLMPTTLEELRTKLKEACAQI